VIPVQPGNRTGHVLQLASFFEVVAAMTIFTFTKY
jgi:hypothetical protein